MRVCLRAVAPLAAVFATSAVPAVASNAVPAVATSAAPTVDYTVVASELPIPERVAEGLRGELSDTALSVSDPQGEPLMDLWFVRQLPAATVPPTDPAINYGSLPEGSVLGVMRLHREHRDFRDQAVPAGVYVMRYLQQPADGAHLGETTFRDFAVLVSPATARSAAPQRFDVTLGQALTLNTHPFVWGLWPAAYVATAQVPGVAAFESDKWALRVDLPRESGEQLALALVVVGNERTY